MNTTSRRFADLKKTFFLVEVKKPSDEIELRKWCATHISTGCYTYSDRYSVGENILASFWFELDKDAMIFKLKFA